MLIFNYNFWETWENPQLVTFDPINKLIIVNSGVTSLDAGVDLYSNWKEWVLTYDNSKWEPAFFTFGGEPTSEYQATPSYYFLTNGWKIFVKDVNIVVQTNLYSDDGLSPFVVENASVTNRTSDVPIVRSSIEKRLDYGDRVYFDSDSQYSGYEHPVGTIAEPVNNLEQAIYIANTYNITKIYIRSNVTITDDYNLSGFDLYGDKNGILVTSNINTPTLEDTRFYQLTVQGNFAGSNTSIINGIVGELGLYDINGNISNCEISARIKVDNDLIISNCFSGVDTEINGLTLDMNIDKGVKTSVRAYSGGIKVLNCLHETDITSIELIAGKITLDESCQNGKIDIRGVGYLNNYATSGCTVITTGFVDSFGKYLEETKETDEYLAYQNEIYLNLEEGYGYSGLTYPIGTSAYPCGNLYDLLTISLQRNIRNVISRSDVVTVDWLPIVSGYFTIRTESPGLKITIPDGTFYEHVKIVDFYIDYADFKNQPHQYHNCRVGDIYNTNGIFNGCSLDGRVDNSGTTLRFTSNSSLINCSPTTVNSLPHIELWGDNGINVGLRNYNGGISVDRMVNDNDYFSVDLVAGYVVIGSGCTNGYIDLRGVGYIINNAGSGVTLNTTGFVDSFQTYVEETKELNEYLSYQNEIYYNSDSNYSGLTYPVGTSAFPVNNIYDLLTISLQRNIRNVISRSDVVTVSPLPIVSGYFTIKTDSPGLKLTVPDGTYYEHVNINGFYVDYANFKGQPHKLINSKLGNIYNLNGVVENCQLEGKDDNMDNAIRIFNETTFINCYPESVYDPPYIELVNPSGTTVAFRGYLGGIIINKMSNPNDRISIDMQAGKVIITSGCTNGYIDLRGVGYIENYAGSGVTLITDGFVSSNNPDLLNIINNIDSNVTSISGITSNINNKSDIIIQDVINISNDIIEIDESLTDIILDINELDNDVSFISGKTYEMNDNVLNMTSGFTNIESSFDNVVDSVDIMSNKVELLDDKISFISGKTYEMNDNVLNMTSGFTNIESGFTEIKDSIDEMTEQVNDMFISINNLDAQIKRILGLTQENFRIVDHVYDSNNALTTATIKIYNNNIDCDNDINPLETYSMSALYDSSGRLTNYKVRRN